MLINIVDIKINTKNDTTRRIRKSHGAIVQLAQSIAHHGLMHPIVVDELVAEGGSQDPMKDPDYKYILIAGERRLKACILNGDSTIEATLFAKTTNIVRKEMELEENVIRKQLSWEEECEAVSQLDELKRKRYGSAQRSDGIEGKKGWGMKETAEALGMSLGAVGQDIKLARDLKEHPELRKKVRKMPKHAARKIVKQAIHTNKLKRQLELKEITISSEIKLGNCVDLIKELKNDSIDLLITDPPFAVPEIVAVAGKSSSMTYNFTETNVGDEDTLYNTYNVLIPELYRVLKPGAHFYMFFGHAWYSYLTYKFRNVGFLVDDSPLIWNKMRCSIMAKDMHYMSSYEAILFGHKPPSTRILKKPVLNILNFPAIPGQKRVHGLQRPFDLLKLLIENSSVPGETILDCFAGSGSTIQAAKKLQRTGIGFELDEGNFLRAQAYINKEDA